MSSEFSILCSVCATHSPINYTEYSSIRTTEYYLLFNDFILIYSKFVKITNI